MMHWLIPRLGAFKDANPKAEVRLNVNYGMIDFIKDEIRGVDSSRYPLTLAN